MLILAGGQLRLIAATCVLLALQSLQTGLAQQLLGLFLRQSGRGSRNDSRSLGCERWRRGFSGRLFSDSICGGEGLGFQTNAVGSKNLLDQSGGFGAVFSTTPTAKTSKITDTSQIVKLI